MNVPIINNQRWVLPPIKKGDYQYLLMPINLINMLTDEEGAIRNLKHPIISSFLVVTQSCRLIEKL